MASIDRTAYPRFKRVVSARELAEALTPTSGGAGWARERTQSDQHRQFVRDRLGVKYTPAEVREVAEAAIRKSVYSKDNPADLINVAPHIAQVIAARRDINVTMGYKAVYPEKGHPVLPGLSRPAADTEPHRQGMAGVSRPLRASESINWNLWARLLDALYS